MEIRQHLQMTATAEAANLGLPPASYAKGLLPKEAIKGTNLVEAKYKWQDCALQLIAEYRMMDIANITICLFPVISFKQKAGGGFFFWFYEQKTEKQMHLIALRLHILYFVASLSKEKAKCRKNPKARDA